MKCWNSAFNAQGSGVIIVVVQIGAVKIYVSEVVAHSRKAKDRMKLSFSIIGGKTSLGPSYFLL
jgi:hypothetical protein